MLPSEWICVYIDGAKSMRRKDVQQQELIAGNKWCLQSLMEKRLQRPWSSSLRCLTKCPYSGKHSQANTQSFKSSCCTHYRSSALSPSQPNSITRYYLFRCSVKVGRSLVRSAGGRECSVSLKAIYGNHTKTSSCCKSQQFKRNQRRIVLRPPCNHPR